jgi:3-deoxy-D-arabino-heptulosonate 7-phosphate (DAHP) synthase class II
MRLILSANSVEDEVPFEDMQEHENNYKRRFQIKSLHHLKDWTSKGSDSDEFFNSTVTLAPKQRLPYRQVAQRLAGTLEFVNGYEVYTNLNYLRNSSAYVLHECIIFSVTNI